MEKTKRKTAIEAIGDVPWGSHFCLFYQTQEDLTEILVPYFKAGLENNECCMWVASEPLSVEDAKRSLKRVVKNLDDYIEKGQIEILDYSQWYTKSGKFEADKVLQGWVEKEKQAVKRGFDGLRLTGNTCWPEKEDWREFTAYEARIDRVIGQYRMLALCTYSLDRCGASEVMDVVSNHELALIRRQGKWEAIQSAKRKWAVQALRESEAMFRKLAEASTGAILIHRGANFCYANPAAERIAGYARQEFLAMNFYDIVHPDFRELVRQRGLARQRGEDLPPHYEFKIITKSGEERWVEITPTSIEFEGEPAVLAAVFDITERKQAEEALREKEEFSRALFEYNPVETVVVDREGKVTMFNLARRESGGRLPNIGDVMYRDYAGKHESDMYGELMGCIRSGEVMEFPELRYQQKFLSITIAPFPKGAIIISRDITKRKRAEEALGYRLEFEKLVASISTQFISTTADDIPSRMSDTLSRIAQFVSADRSYVLLFSADRTQIADVYEWCAEEIEPHAHRLKGLSVGAFSWVAEGMKQSQTLCIRRVADLPHEAGAEKELLQEGAVQSAVAVPMVLGGKVIGILGFDSVRQEKAWSEDIILLLRIVGQILANVVQRKRAEEALKASETCYRRLFEAAKDGILLLNAQTGQITDVNPCLVGLLGYSHQEFLGKKIWEIGVFKDIAASQAAFEKLQSKEYVRYEHLPLETKDGRQIEVEFVSNVYGVDDEKVVQCNIRDITDRRQAEERLLAYQENLRSLASELSLVEERERRRIASYLHDQIGQSLAAVRMKFGALKQAGGSADIAGMVDEIQALLAWTIRDTRSLTFELSPPILYELGLEAALEWLSERIGEEHGIRIEFTDDAHSKPLEDDVRGLLFRAVDELLINIVKHANTRSGKVSILRDGDHVRILVEDDGVGFDATTIGSRTSQDRGFGLFSVRERLRYIGGHVEVESERGHGTRVTLIAPLRRDRASLEGGAPCK
jgi:PAS domain S-box-containing protein